MNLNELKKLIAGDNSKIIIIENGEPLFVVMNFEEYKKTKRPLNGNNNDLKSAQNFSKELEEEPLKIEDLPF